MGFIAGRVVGLNRDRARRPAGLRTSINASVGSALFVMVILQVRVDFIATNALIRTVQGITTGVGFISAGVIFLHARDKREITQIRALTSAAASGALLPLAQLQTVAIGA